MSRVNTLMMRFGLVMIIAMINLPSQAFGVDICKMRSAASRMSNLTTYDKHRHCGTTCVGTFYCYGWFVRELGIKKEILDIITPGRTPELADLKANEAGIKIAQQVKSEYKGKSLGLQVSYCYRQCRDAVR